MPSQQMNLTHLDGAHHSRGEAYHLAHQGDRDWTTNDSELQHYMRHLVFVGSENDHLADIVGQQIGHHPSNVGLDLAGGSNGKALDDLIARGIIGRGLFTNYTDTRTPQTEARPDLDHIEGDLLDPRVWHDLRTRQKQQAPNGFAVILHRPMGGLQAIEPPAAYRGSAHLLIDMLRPGGLFFTQVPRSLTRGCGTAALHDLCRTIMHRPDVGKVRAAQPSHEDYMPEHAVLIYKT